MLTGDEGDLARLEAFRAGVRDYIPRPFLDEELVIRVHRVAAPPTPTANPGLRGNLVDIGLGTLLSLFEFERKSGILLSCATARSRGCSSPRARSSRSRRARGNGARRRSG